MFITPRSSHVEVNVIIDGRRDLQLGWFDTWLERKKRI